MLALFILILFLPVLDTHGTDCVTRFYWLEKSAFVFKSINTTFLVFLAIIF